jgi:2-dehydro-3-deoxygluconokinase
MSMGATAVPVVVTLGEIMLRLGPPGHERLLQSPMLEASFGGGEANVAVALAQWGVEARFVTALPDGPLGDAALTALRGLGVDVRHVVRRAGRLGIYFVERGAAQRSSSVIYDRDGSAISQVAAAEFDWPAIMAGSTWFHVTGVTPAISASAAEVALTALRVAREAGTRVSIDLNYRATLWRYGRSAPEVMRELVDLADVAIGNEEDCQLALGLEADADVRAGRLERTAYERLTARVMEAHPSLSVVALTLRESHGADVNGWSACLRDREGFCTGPSFEILDIVDRVGSGDAFAAGLIRSLAHGLPAADALSFAVAAGCLKHSVPGDFNRVSLAEVQRLVAGDASGRVRR